MQMSGCYYCANTMYFLLLISTFLPIYNSICTVITFGHSCRRIYVYIISQFLIYNTLGGIFGPN